MILLVQVQTGVTEDGDAHHGEGGKNHRRSLVREAAPRVVDATAVELLSSPHTSVSASI